MPTVPRRVVTGHDARGISVFASDGPVPAARIAPDGALFYELWATDAAPARVAFVLVDGVFTQDLLGTLGPDVLGGLLHDPMA